MDKKDDALVPLVPPENKVGLLFFILICYNYLNYNDLNGTALYVNFFSLFLLEIFRAGAKNCLSFLKRYFDQFFITPCLNGGAGI